MDYLNKKYNISEIFYSIQGEGSRSGFPCTFVRMHGCRLRCSWCDTPYALDMKDPEKVMTGREVLAKVVEIDCPFVEFTGGEPLEQAGVPELMKDLCEKGFTVAVETAGYIDISSLDQRIIKIMDVKCPGSEMHKKNKYGNFEYLDQKDEIKFVIKDLPDFNFAVETIDKYNLFSKSGNILFSPVFGELENIELAEWILHAKLNVRMQVQMHKYIWHPEERGV
jgi:7-carboxy-7-deazaguanine synthase